MCREAFALLSSTHPLVPSQLMGELKKGEAKDRPKKRGQITFQWMPFSNPARSDGLQLSHWVKCYKDATSGRITPADKEYPFAKYNKTIKVFRYDDDEWTSLIASDQSWSREETGYLLDLIESLDMRWLAIADRYDFPGGQPRSVEDIKGRYYSVARQLLIGREGSAETIANHSLVKHPFSVQHERERKKGLELLMQRTPEQDAAEEEVLAEAAKIEAKRKAEAGGRRGGLGGGQGGVNGVGGAPQLVVEVSEIEIEPAVGTPPLLDTQGKPVLPSPAPDSAEGTPTPRVVARTSHIREVVEGIVNAMQPEKAQKMLQGSMAELKLAELPRATTRRVGGAYLALLREVMEHLELKRQFAAKQAMVGAKRAAREEPMDGAELRSEKRQRVAKKSYDD